MLWLNYLRQSGGAYADLKKYLADWKAQSLAEFVSAQDMDQVNRLKGAVDKITSLQLIVTQEERADRERAIRADTQAREQRGESRAH